MKHKQICDVAVVGAGAAGLMSSIWAARQKSGGSSTHKNFSIILLDSREKIGAKILISGGTRCNVTNRSVKPTDYFGGASHFVKHALEAFSPQSTIAFFQEIGVELILEPTGKYFPVTHSGKTVLEALTREAKKRGVELICGARVQDIEKKDRGFDVKTDGAGTLFAKRVILATGGLSLPETGSDGRGIEIAQQLGHRIIFTTPALSPLLSEDKEWRELSGIALEVAMYFYAKGRKQFETKGPLLFTHFGFSGPTALDLSRFFIRASKDELPEVRVSFLPYESQESLAKKIDFLKKQSPRKMLKNILSDDFLLPARFVETFLKKLELDPKIAISDIRDKHMRRWISRILDFRLDVNGVYGYRKAEATAGGVDLKEVNIATMESKKVPGLFFAGEILDVDGRIGGYNFQWAWSTGAIAGKGATQDLS